MQHSLCHIISEAMHLADQPYVLVQRFRFVKPAVAVLNDVGTIHIAAGLSYEVCNDVERQFLQKVPMWVLSV